MYRLGIDLGGTNIAAGVVDDSYRLISKMEIKTGLPRSAEQIADDIAGLVEKVLHETKIDIASVESFGIGSPGIINSQEGIVLFANNLGFHNVPLAKMLEERIGKRFYLGNDANAAAFGEFIAGSGLGTKNFIAVILGTGVGGGIIINKKIYTGSNFVAGELGHFVIRADGRPCSCGKRGCWETYASATALIQDARQAMMENPDSILWELVQGDIHKMTGKTVFDGWTRGDLTAKTVINRYISYLAIGIGSIINIFQPDVVCVGGGISRQGTILTEPINRIVYSDNFASALDNKTKILPAVLGNDAGIIGAAFLDKAYEF